MAENDIAMADLLRELRKMSDPNPELLSSEDEHGTGYAVVKDGYRVVYMDGELKGCRRHHIHSLESLVDWLQKQTHAGGEVLVGLDSISAEITPGSVGSDGCLADMPWAPHFEAWGDLLGNEDHTAYLDQKGFQTLVRQTRSTFYDTDVPDVLLSELQKLSVTRTADIETEIDAAGATTWSSATASNQIRGSFPESITVQTAIYDGVQRQQELVSYRFEVFLGFEADARRFVLTAPTLGTVLRVARGDLADHVRGQLDPSWYVGLGHADIQIVPSKQFADPRTTRRRDD